jgi:ADP-ribose pyrophosphatase YjhB (NUDIX family)
MAREPIPTWYFALVVVRRGHRFLAVREVKHGQLWYLPAGGAEPGESLAEGARREVLDVFRYVADGGPISPMSLLKHEGDAFYGFPGRRSWLRLFEGVPGDVVRRAFVVNAEPSPQGSLP